MQRVDEVSVGSVWTWCVQRVDEVCAACGCGVQQRVHEVSVVSSGCGVCSVWMRWGAFTHEKKIFFVFSTSFGSRFSKMRLPRAVFGALQTDTRARR